MPYPVPCRVFIAAAYLGSKVVDHATSYICPLTGQLSLKRHSKLLPAVPRITWSRNGEMRFGCRRYNCHVGQISLPITVEIIMVKWAIELRCGSRREEERKRRNGL